MLMQLGRNGNSALLLDTKLGLNYSADRGRSEQTDAENVLLRKVLTLLTKIPTADGTVGCAVAAP
jgi:hypothetical protein